MKFKSRVKSVIHEWYTRVIFASNTHEAWLYVTASIIIHVYRENTPFNLDSHNPLCLILLAQLNSIKARCQNDQAESKITTTSLSLTLHE
jgi:hypothetical protein